MTLRELQKQKKRELDLLIADNTDSETNMINPDVQEETEHLEKEIETIELLQKIVKELI